MPVKVKIPSALRRFTGDQPFVEVAPGTVKDVVGQMLEQHGQLKPHLLDGNGNLRNFVNVYVNGQDIRQLKGEETPVNEGDQLIVVPAIAGGAGGLPMAGGNGNGGLSRDELIRYSRHLLIPEVGVAGQKRLRDSKVLLVGMGGLGSPIAQYLAAAGVGTIGIVEFDTIDMSNLQRQVLYSTDQVGQSKAEKAKERVQGLNPNVHVVLHQEKLTSANALDIVKNYDVVVDGTDNFPTRYLVNDACVLAGKPNVYGSIFRFEGQVSVFWAEKGPCYRCLYPTPPPPGLVPSCAEGGVLGVLPGIIGTMQANETIKVLLGIGDPLVGRLLLFDALEMSFTTVRLNKNPDCLVCSDHPTVTHLIDYEDFCGLSEPIGAKEGATISVQELKRKMDRREDFVLLDVREPFEFEIAQIPGSRLVPMREIENQVGDLDAGKDIVVFCHSGGRSAMVTQYLRGKGFANARNLVGGISAWAQEVDPATPMY